MTSKRERQLLVLANGTHSRKALAALMDKCIDDAIDRLLAMGLLLETHVGVRRPPPHAVVPVPAMEQQLAVRRRSLAATKMYITDMLQLLRDMDASGMAVALHTSDSEAEFMANVFSAVRLICDKSGPSYALRVLSKLREIIPQPHIAGVEALVADLTETSDVL